MAAAAAELPESAEAAAAAGPPHPGGLARGPPAAALESAVAPWLPAAALESAVAPWLPAAAAAALWMLQTVVPALL